MNTIYLDTQTRMSRFGAVTHKLVVSLKRTVVSSSLLDQLFRSASSVGANFAEARSAESRADFLHKLKVALKECREARHWLMILHDIPETPKREISELLNENDRLCAILYSSVKTAERNDYKGQKGL